MRWPYLVISTATFLFVIWLICRRLARVGNGRKWILPNTTKVTEAAPSHPMSVVLVFTLIRPLRKSIFVLWILSTHRSARNARLTTLPSNRLRCFSMLPLPNWKISSALWGSALFELACVECWLVLVQAVHFKLLPSPSYSHLKKRASKELAYFKKALKVETCWKPPLPRITLFLPVLTATMHPEKETGCCGDRLCFRIDGTVSQIASVFLKTHKLICNTKATHARKKWNPFVC